MTVEGEKPARNKNKSFFGLIILSLVFIFAGIILKTAEKKMLSKERDLVLKASLKQFSLVQRYKNLFPESSFELNQEGENYVFISVLEKKVYVCKIPNHKFTGEKVSFSGLPKLYFSYEVVTEEKWYFSELKELTEEELLKLLEE